MKLGRAPRSPQCEPESFAPQRSRALALVLAPGRRSPRTAPRAAPPRGERSQQRARRAGSRPPRSAPRAHVDGACESLRDVTCVPAAKCSTNPHQVSLRGTLLRAGRGPRRGDGRGVPEIDRRDGSAAHRPPSRLRMTTAGSLVSVPSTAHSGRIKVLLSNGRYTSSYGPLHGGEPTRCTLRAEDRSAGQVAPSGGMPSGTALDGQGMWIW